MEVLQIIALVNQIISKFPGGFSAFNEEGSISALPPPSNDIIIKHPNLPKEVREAIKQVAEMNLGIKAPHPFVQEVGNFSGWSHGRLVIAMGSLIVRIHEIIPTALASYTESVFIVSLPPSRLPQQVDDLIQLLSTTEGLSLSYLYVGGEAQRIYGPAWRDPDHAPAPKVAPKVIQPETRGALTQDDILNLRIRLKNAKSVEEFLKGL